METNYFSGGCFWHIEREFNKLPGIINTTVGYMGGNFSKPKYTDVVSGKTGHAETIKIKYDSNIISFLELLIFFFDIHDPTTLNKQGADIGTNYRSIVFYNNFKQKNIYNKFKNNILYKSKIVTQLIKKQNFKFYKAEKIHQKYYNN